MTRNFLNITFRLSFFVWAVSDLTFFCINIHAWSVAWKRVATFVARINENVCEKIKFEIFEICRVFLEVTSFVYTNTIIFSSLGEQWLFYWLLNICRSDFLEIHAHFVKRKFSRFCSEGDWVPFSAMSWAWMKDSNHFSGLTSAFRAAYEQSNLKVGLISAFDRHRSLKVGLISAFDRHTCINRSISADHALAHALEFGGEWRNLKKVSSTCISL